MPGDSDMEDVAETETETLKKEVIMPGGDRTGPIGLGSQTGRRLGYCVGKNRPGFEENATGFGRGFGRGRGFGSSFGRGRGFGPGFGRGYGIGYRFSNVTRRDYPEELEKQDLRDEIGILKNQIELLEKRLSETGEKKQ